MLVLSRKQDEKILIGPDGPDQITVMVISTSNEKCQLGIQAPKHIPIHREEVANLIRRERQGS